MKKLLEFSLLAVLAASLLASCASSSDDDSDNAASLPPVSAVQVMNSQADDDYATTGGLKVALIALSNDQKSIVNNGLSIAASSDSRAAVTLSVSKIETKAAANSTLPWSVAIDLDSSGSMYSTDSSRLRVTAAKNYVDLILADNAKSQLAVYDFGTGSTTGFTKTRLLQDYTADKTLLSTGIDKCKENGQTPLYDSIYELLQNINTNISATKYQRAIMLLSDGGDNDSIHDEDDTSALATKYAIPINTVALGYDSEVLLDLSKKTNGVYAKASSAADLANIFQSVALGSTQGYVIVSLNFPKNSIPMTATKITLKVTSGGVTKDTTFSFSPY